VSARKRSEAQPPLLLESPYIGLATDPNRVTAVLALMELTDIKGFPQLRMLMPVLSIVNSGENDDYSQKN
jgi:hypothetical protein